MSLSVALLNASTGSTGECVAKWSEEPLDFTTMACTCTRFPPAPADSPKRLLLEDVGSGDPAALKCTVTINLPCTHLASIQQDDESWRNRPMSCQQCSNGSSKGSTGKGACTVCSIGTYSNSEWSACVKCPFVTHYSLVGSDSITDCGCPHNKSATQNGTRCSCDAGFKEECLSPVRTLAGSGTSASEDGEGLFASFIAPMDIAVTTDGSMAMALVTESNRVRIVPLVDGSSSVATVSTLVGLLWTLKTYPQRASLAGEECSTYLRCAEGLFCDNEIGFCESCSECSDCPKECEFGQLDLNGDGCISDVEVTDHSDVNFGEFCDAFCSTDGCVSSDDFKDITRFKELGTNEADNFKVTLATFRGEKNSVLLSVVADQGVHGICEDANFIQLWNPTEEPVDLSYMILTNDKGQLDVDAFHFPEGTVLASGRYLLGCQEAHGGDFVFHFEVAAQIWLLAADQVTTLDTRPITYPQGLAGDPQVGMVWQRCLPDGDWIFAETRGVEPHGIVFVPREDRALAVDRFNHVIRSISLSDGQVSTLAGSSRSFSAIDGNAFASRFYAPSGIAVTSDGTKAVVSEPQVNRLRLISLETGDVSTLAGARDGTSGSSDGYGTSARFNHPTGIAISHDGQTAYIADSHNNQIRTINISTSETKTLGKSILLGASTVWTGMLFPCALALMPDGQNLLVAEPYRLLSYSFTTKKSSIVWEGRILNDGRNSSNMSDFDSRTYPMQQNTDFGRRLSNMSELLLHWQIVAPTDLTACEPLTQDLSGKIALIMAGSCDRGMAAKVLNAQNAGAVAVIIFNKQDELSFADSGGSASAGSGYGSGSSTSAVTIPSTMISYQNGYHIWNLLQTGASVVASMSDASLLHISPGSPTRLSGIAVVAAEEAGYWIMLADAQNHRIFAIDERPSGRDCTCAMCNPGTFSLQGSSQCLSCPSGKFSATMAAGACVSCTQNMTSPVGSTDESMCTCKKGYYAKYYDVKTEEVLDVATNTSILSCRPCPKRQFKDTTGPGVCKDCPDGASSQEASTYSGDCVCSDPGKTVQTVVGENGTVANCVCGAGYYGSGNSPCSMCQAGKYKSTNGTDECIQCFDGTTSPAGSVKEDNCVCTGQGSVQVPAQVRCPGLQNPPAAASSCPCPSNGSKIISASIPATSMSSTSSCEWLIEGKSVQIKFKSLSLFDGAEPHTLTVFECSNEDTCSEIKSTSAKTIATDEIITTNERIMKLRLSVHNGIQLAYTGSEFEAEFQERAPCACSAGRYKDESGSCQLCEASKYSYVPGTLSTCFDCPSHSLSPIGSTSATECRCEAGYAGSNGDVCVACTSGKVKRASGGGVCSSCPTGKYATATAAATSCASCARGKYANDQELAACSARVTCTGSCDCSSVSSGNAEGIIHDGLNDYSNLAYCKWLVVTECSAGVRLTFDYFNTELDYDFITIYQCQSEDCITRTEIDRLSGDQVQNNTEYYSQSGLLQIVFSSDETVTARGFVARWSTEADPCSLCPSHTFSVEGSNSSLACKCNAGYTGDAGSTCEACAPGTYKSSTGRTADCQVCPRESWKRVGHDIC